MRYDISDETYTTHEHDVVVIGAGGAGLRAAIAASQEGASVALVCKSMLGKAHTVMAEGGAAAALANKDPRDNWKVHFRDTMKGGKYLNDWRMAVIHAQQAPGRGLHTGQSHRLHLASRLPNVSGVLDAAMSPGRGFVMF